MIKFWSGFGLVTIGFTLFCLISYLDAFKIAPGISGLLFWLGYIAYPIRERWIENTKK